MSTDETTLILSIADDINAIMALMKKVRRASEKLDINGVELTSGQLDFVDGNGHDAIDGIYSFKIALGELASKKNLSDPLLTNLINEYKSLE
jgi:hypothetical protein